MPHPNYFLIFVVLSADLSDITGSYLLVSKVKCHIKCKIFEKHIQRIIEWALTCAFCSSITSTNKVRGGLNMLMHN